MADSVSSARLSSITAYWTTRRKIYALWAVIVGVGFMITQFYQNLAVLAVWALLVLGGLKYTYLLGRHNTSKFRQILNVWVVIVFFGSVVSFLALASTTFAGFTPYLGVFWLLLMGLGHWTSGQLDTPSTAYLASGTLQIVAGIVCLSLAPLLAIQYFVAGAIGSLAFIWLILYR